MFSETQTPNEEQLVSERTSSLRLSSSSCCFNDLWEKTSKVTRGNEGKPRRKEGKEDLSHSCFGYLENCYGGSL